MRMAVFCDELLRWQGGRDVFRILFESLKLGCAAEDEITIAIWASRDSLSWRAAHIGKHLLTKFPHDYRWIAREIRHPKKKLIRGIIGERARLAIFRGKESHRRYFRAFP